jgi:hypothetical protein
VAERLGVPLKPGNAGRGKGPWFITALQRLHEISAVITRTAGLSTAASGASGTCRRNRAAPGCWLTGKTHRGLLRDLLGDPSGLSMTRSTPLVHDDLSVGRSTA